MVKTYRDLTEFRKNEAELWQSDWLNEQYQKLNARFEDRLLQTTTVRDEIRRGVRQSDEQIEVTLYAWIERFLSKVARYVRLEDVVVGAVKGAIIFDLLGHIAEFEPYFNYEQFWQRYQSKRGGQGICQMRLFDSISDRQALLIKQGIKSALATPQALYEVEGEPLPQVGDIKLVCYQNGNVACATRTTVVDNVAFNEVPRMQAYYEADGDGSLSYWQMTRQLFFKRVLQAHQLVFTETTPIVLERFDVIATPFDLVYN